MRLYINGCEYFGDTEIECVERYLKDPFLNSNDFNLIDNVENRIADYIFSNNATAEELEKMDAGEIEYYDIYEKYVSKKLILKCFLEYIQNNPIKCRGHIYFMD